MITKEEIEKSLSGIDARPEQLCRISRILNEVEDWEPNVRLVKTGYYEGRELFVILYAPDKHKHIAINDDGKLRVIEYDCETLRGRECACESEDDAVEAVKYSSGWFDSLLGKQDEIKYVTLSEATESQIIDYIIDNREEFGVPDNVKLVNAWDHYSLTRYCDVIEVKFYEVYLPSSTMGYCEEIFSLQLDPYMRIETTGQCLYEPTPADGNGLW